MPNWELMSIYKLSQTYSFLFQSHDESLDQNKLSSVFLTGAISHSLINSILIGQSLPNHHFPISLLCAPVIKNNYLNSSSLPGDCSVNRYLSLIEQGIGISNICHKRRSWKTFDSSGMVMRQDICFPVNSTHPLKNTSKIVLGFCFTSKRYIFVYINSKYIYFPPLVLQKWN